MSTRNYVNVRVSWNDSNERLVREGALEGLADALHYLLGEANKIVPLDESTLQSSGAVSVDNRQMVGVVSYDTPYAARLHEHPEYNFQRGREGKWLEKTWRTKRATATRLIRNGISRRMGDL
jgi:hypothetical protein